MRFLNQTTEDGIPEPALADNAVLDQFEIPFGAWIDQTVDWITADLGWLLSIVEWPFNALIDLLVEDILEPVSWVWVVLAFFVIGSLVRNFRVGAFAALGLGVCGILGNAYWVETARTLGYIGVAVLLCVIIGIPVGIVCGRVDTVWKTVRPILDAMQVVHAFVYMLPIIYFFGVGEVSATMVTMVFALPPLIRLTNLGIRQVPEDVIEASRAYGAPEWRVLTDVQIPLARPAIMTGLNQTLLLAISMLGIAAIMGAGGLGRLLLGALNRQRVDEGAAAGLAFFLVAVVLDRISQPEKTDQGSLFRRIRLAWAHRRDPEALLDSRADSTEIQPTDTDTEAIATATMVAVSPAERTSVVVTAVGGVLAGLSVLFTWTKGAGFISAYGRRGDEDLAGQSFNGLSATGGSWFGVLVLVLGLFAVAAAVTTLVTGGRGPRWWTADGAVIASLALLVTAICYLLVAPSGQTVGQTTGIGVYVALIGALIATIGSLWWVCLAPHSPVRPLSARIGWSRVIGSTVAVVIIGVGAISAWSFDRRTDVIFTADVTAQIDALVAEAEANPADAAVLGAEISALAEQLNVEKAIIISGVSSEGSRLGIWTLLAGVAGLAVTLPAAGVFGRRDDRQWLWSAITAGIGAGIACVSFGWIFTHVRSADDNYLSGVGSFLALMGGCVLVATTVGVLKEFRRRMVYSKVSVEPKETVTPAIEAATVPAVVP